MILQNAINPSSGKSATCNFSVAMTNFMEMHERLKAARKARFRTATEAAAYLGIPQATYAHHEKGTRKVRPDEAERYAKAFRVSPSWLMFGADGPPMFAAESGVSPDPVPALTTLKIVGEVAAGVWRSAIADAMEPESYNVPADPRFNPEGQFLLRVVGSSINRQAPSGALVRCLDVYFAPRDPRNDDWVIVRRMRDGEAEKTVKRLHILANGKHEMWPDSTDPNYQEPVIMGEQDGDEIEICAFVLDFIKPATRI